MIGDKIKRLIRERRLPDLGFWLRNTGTFWREFRPETAGAWHVLSAEPAVIYMMLFGNEFRKIGARLGRRRAWLLVSNPWIPYGDAEAGELRKTVEEHARQHPAQTLVFLCNEEAEAELLRRHGLRAEFCHQNAFIDERIFDVRPEIPKRLDAVYAAQLIGYKRHALAGEVSNLGLLCYTSRWCLDRGYIRDVKRRFARAEWGYEPGRQRMTDRGIADYLNTARVGLCLSAHEGGMYASMEYLLCGLPIVNTPSVGGREALFDPDCVRQVDPDPGAVRRGVEELLARRLPPEFVRARALARIAPHRETLVRLMNGIFAEAGRPAAYAWGDRFVNKLSRRRNYADLTGELAEAARSGPGRS